MRAVRTLGYSRCRWWQEDKWVVDTELGSLKVEFSMCVSSKAQQEKAHDALRREGRREVEKLEGEMAHLKVTSVHADGGALPVRHWQMSLMQHEATESRNEALEKSVHNANASIDALRAQLLACQVAMRVREWHVGHGKPRVWPHLHCPRRPT